MNKIPVYLPKQDKLFLVFSACRVLNSLLRNKLGGNKSDIFEFIDLLKEGTILVLIKWIIFFIKMDIKYTIWIKILYLFLFYLLIVNEI